jgi:DNA-binding response OmpR family regulator
VLAIDQDAQALKQIQTAMTAKGIACDTALGLVQARAAMEAGTYSVIVVDELQQDGSGLDLVRELSAGEGGPRLIVTSARPALEGAVEAIRCGASDFVAKPFKAAELVTRVEAALETARRLRDERRRVERLRRMCKRLNTAREEVSRQVDVLCNDLVHAYQELADQMGSVSLSCEFGSIVRQELDVESLLRSTLEFLLVKTGPTNAAIFLPTGNHDFSLGAYVNYDVPKDAADVLLDQLADTLAPRFEHQPEVEHFTRIADLNKRMGQEAPWLADSTAITFACRDGGDCLAVVALFRDRRNPFPEELLPQLAVIRDVFGEQLARVVRIHHRHLPKDTWPGFDVEDDRGMAA